MAAIRNFRQSSRHTFHRTRTAKTSMSISTTTLPIGLKKPSRSERTTDEGRGRKLVQRLKGVMSMARRAFFSFHYERDAWRAGQVRNSWVTKDRESAGFWDAAAWEEVKKKGNPAIEKWIDDQLKGTSVTVVLIGAQTSTREYVGYEIK